MATFKVRVEDLCGAVNDDTALSDWLTEGARYVADKMRPERLILYATDKADPDGNTGISLTGGRALSAHKAGYEAKLIPRGMVAKAKDGDSLHYALATDPIWYMDSSMGYVIPGGGTIKWFGYPTVAYGDSTITNYPSEALGAIVLYGAIQGQGRKISDLVATTMSGISWSVTNTLPTIASQTVTYTKPTFGGSTPLSSMTTALGNQDVELARGYGEQVNLYLSQYGADIQNELNEFNKEAEQAKVNFQEYQLEISNYQAEVQKEAARIQSIIGQYASMSQSYFTYLASLKEEFNRLVETL